MMSLLKLTAAVFLMPWVLMIVIGIVHAAILPLVFPVGYSVCLVIVGTIYLAQFFLSLFDIARVLSD